MSTNEEDLNHLLLEQKVDSKFERLLREFVSFRSEVKDELHEFQLEFRKIDANFKVMDKEINWLKWLTGGTFFILLGLLINAAVKSLPH